MANKERMVEVASALMAEHGYALVTMDMVIERTGIAKSNAYYHYSNKELLGIDVLHYWCDAFAKLDQITLLHPSSSLERLDGYRNRLIQFENASGFVGDPISTICTQMGTDAAQGKFDAYSKTHLNCLISCIEYGQTEGTVNRDLKPKAVSEFVHLTILGALAEIRASKQITPLSHGFACILEMLAS